MVEWTDSDDVTILNNVNDVAEVGRPSYTDSNIFVPLILKQTC